jgi:hypothetical protein
MPIKKYQLATLPPPAVHRRVRPAQKQLYVAHTTLQGVFESLHVVRTASAGQPGGTARGRLKEGEVDLLRCAIVLAGAGMDAVVRRLATDALPTLLESPAKYPEAAKRFRQHVADQVKVRGAPKSWVEAILSDDPRPEMIRLYVGHLTQGSLQSETDLRRVRDALGVTQEISDETIVGLKGFLIARNQVAHDLDLKRPDDETRGSRYSRTVPKVLEQCNEVVRLTSNYVTGVSELLRRRKAPR